MNGNGVDKLAAAKAERSRLRVALADVSARRGKVGVPVEALCMAECVADDVAHSAAVAKWMHGGSKGARPVRENFAAALTPEILAARDSAARALPELEKLNAETANITAEIAAANAAIFDAAAITTAARFAALADRANALRQELADIEDELAGGFHHFIEELDRFFERVGQRNPALIAPQQAALGGFDEEVSAIRDIPMPDREMLVKHREDFARLQKG